MTLAQLTDFGVALGEAAARAVPTVVTLTGDLGAGKTTLTRAMGRGFGVVEPVTSPTFALVHEYIARDYRRFFHLDLYRISGPHELANIGWEALLSERALVVIEWPDRAGDLLPKDHLAISLAHLDDDDERRRVSW
jgi:tRNA threonylcarbamoyladenosine biosynthesis protein TsaE